MATSTTRWIAVVLTAGSSLLALSQDTLEGVVMDERGVPIEQAHCVVGQSVVMTNAEGQFRFETSSHLMQRQVKLSVSHLGYSSVEMWVLWPSSEVKVIMTSEGQTLSPALVASSLTGTSSVAEVRPLEVDMLDAVPATSRIQALRAVAGVHMMSAGQGMLRPVLRGLSGLRVATLFLNARVESQAWGEGHGIFFPEQGVARMDVIRGPEVLQSGPDAYGGVLRVVPVGPLSEPGRLTQLSVSGHSNTKGIQASVMTQKRSERAHHVLLSGVNRFNEYRLPDGEMVMGSALRQFYSQGRFGYIRDWGTWEGAYSSCYNTAGIVGPGGTEQSGDHMLTTGAHFQTGAWKWHPTLSYQLNHRKELSVVGPDSLTEDNERRYTQLDLSLRATRLDVFADRAGESGWTWTVGAQGHVKSNSNDTALIDLNAQWIPDADMAGSGGFVRVSHTQGAWVPSASIRGDVHHISWATRSLPNTDVDAILGDGSRSFQMLSGAVGVKWVPSDRHLWGLSLMRGNRAPGLSELLATGNHFDSFREERGDPNLGIETSHGLELQWVKQPVMGQQWCGDVAAYASCIDNFMLLVPTSEVNAAGLPVQLHQATTAFLKGIDANVKWVSAGNERWSVKMAASYVDSRDAFGEVLPWTPPATGRCEVQKMWGGTELLKGTSALVFEASRDALLWHASTTLTSGPHWTVRAQLINLTNARYIPTLSLLQNLGVPEPGRNVRLQLVHSW